MQHVMGTTLPSRPLEVLLATDLSAASLPHLTFAARLVHQLGGRSTLFHAAVPLPMTVPLTPAEVPYAPTVDVEASRRQLQEIAATLPVDRPVHVAIERASNARKAILDAAERLHADLLVLPSHGRSGLPRALLGSTAEDVVRHATRPVLLVTDHMLRPAVPQRAERRFVMVPIDLADAATTALVPAAGLAQRLHLPLLLMAVLPTREGPPLGGGAPVAPRPTDPQQRVQHALRELRQLAMTLGNDVPTEVFACLADEAAAAIVAKATELDAALLVVATHGRTGLARLFRGSVAEDLVRTAAVPVVCVPMPHD